MRRALILACLALPLPAAAERPRPARPAAAQAPATADPSRAALALAQQNRWPEAEQAATSADPRIARVVTWMRMQSRTGGASAGEIIGFLEANPDWPLRDTLLTRAEEQLAYEASDAVALRAAALRPARQLDAAQRQADALMRAGRGPEAVALLGAAWVGNPGDPTAEATILAAYGSALTTAQHQQRFEKLALGRDTAATARMLPLLDANRRTIGEARLAYAADRGEIDTPAMASAAASDGGLTLERARFLRRRGQDNDAAAAWQAGAPAQRDLSPELARAIWVERQILARRLLRQGNAAAAYAVVAAHGQTAPGEPRQDAEFLAGFIALRLLNQPRDAVAHFEKVRQDSRSAITQARSHYWQGRALAALGRDRDARAAFTAAAAFPVAFYGQLGSVALGESGAQLTTRIRQQPSPAVSAAQLARLQQSEPGQVAQALTAIGESRRARTFLLRLEELATTPEDKAAVAQFATRLGRPDHAIWIARRAGAQGAVLFADGWPAPYAAGNLDLEPPLVFAISRQESNFDPEAVSSANARGVMQLLPATAAQTARRLGIPHQVGWLTSDPAHNMRLGSAYLAQMTNRFDGALPLAIASYNAGPGRVDEWVGAFGDPRSGMIAMLDWMELIPFSETRNYVQRVLENLTIYRALDAAAAGQEHPMARWLADPVRPAGG